MNQLKVFHTGDIHYCPKHLDGVDRCFAFAIDKAIENKCEVAVLNGDLFDHRVDLHSPAVSRILTRVSYLSEHMPVIVAQGTFSHDVPGSLDVFKTLGGKFPVFVADRICQIGLITRNGISAFVPSDGWTFTPEEIYQSGFLALFSSLPSINKGAVAAVVGAENAGEAVGEHVAAILKGWSPANLTARNNGIPTIGFSHGTVSGSVTEQGVVMAGLDHEYTIGSIFAAECSAFLINHIHQEQNWEHQGRRAGYSGSLERLHFGEVKPKGFLVWDVYDSKAELQFIETPAKTLLQIDFEGTPDMAELERQAANCEGAHVRVRYSVDEEFRHSVDKEAIRALFEKAAELKIEGRVNPIQRTRSAGITRMSLQDKLRKWCEVTSTDVEPLKGRLQLLTHAEPEAVVAEILGDNKKQEKAA